MLHLVTFADSRMKRSVSRLLKQANAFDLFDFVHCFDEFNLPDFFKILFKDRLILGSRGFGYWSWKPIIISEVLNKMNFGDCLLYLDVGCHLNIQGKKRLIEYFEILKKSEQGIIAFQASPPNSTNSNLQYDGRDLIEQPNYQWIKGDLLDFFGVRDVQAFTHAQAIGAGIILLKKCNNAQVIINEWVSITLNHFNLIDDSISISPNPPGFIEHRHDQALWTLLCLKNKVKIISAYEYWYPKKTKSNKSIEPDWEALTDFPIHARRDKDIGIFNLISLKCGRIFQKLKISVIRKLK